MIRSWGPWSNLVFLHLIVILSSSGCMEFNIAVSGGKPHVSRPTGKMKVSHHYSVPLTENDVNKILADAVTIANTSDGQGDFACPITFELDGAVGQFNFEIIRDENDLDYLNTNHQGIKVVKDILWCGTSFWPGFLGCQKDSGIVVVRTDPEDEGILWLHEFGHLQNLNHRNHENAV